MSLPNINEIELLHERMCKAVGDPTRIMLIYALNEKPRNVTSLANDLNIPQPTVSRHLALLRDRGIVRSERDGASVIYSLTDSRIIDVLNNMRQLLRDSISQNQESISK